MLVCKRSCARMDTPPAADQEAAGRQAGRGGRVHGRAVLEPTAKPLCCCVCAVRPQPLDILSESIEIASSGR